MPRFFGRGAVQHVRYVFENSRRIGARVQVSARYLGTRYRFNGAKSEELRIRLAQAKQVWALYYSYWQEGPRRVAKVLFRRLVLRSL